MVQHLDDVLVLQTVEKGHLLRDHLLPNLEEEEEEEEEKEEERVSYVFKQTFLQSCSYALCTLEDPTVPAS